MTPIIMPHRKEPEAKPMKAMSTVDASLICKRITDAAAVLALHAVGDPAISNRLEVLVSCAEALLAGQAVKVSITAKKK